MYYGSFNLKNIKQETLELMVSLVFGISCLLLYWFFPADLNDIIEVFIRLFLFLFIFPIIYVRVILKKSFRDMGIGKYKYNSQANLPILTSFLIGLAAIIILAITPLGEYYLLNILPPGISQSFKIFLIYQVLLIPIVLFIFIYFSFGFMNLITKDHLKINLYLPIFIYFLLMLSFLDANAFNYFLITLLLTTSVVLFNRIMCLTKNIWSVYAIILSLNIILNTLIIKLAL